MKTSCFSIKIGVLDYGLGNIRSVCNAIEFLGYEYETIQEAEQLKFADILVLPGVGAFSEGIKNLQKQGLVDELTKQVITEEKPILGICLGMQLFADSSDEKGMTEGLGWIKGNVLHLKTISDKPLPHVGWNNVKRKIEKPLYVKNAIDSSFYFDHSYFFQCEEKNCVSGHSSYGASFPVSIQKENIFGVQFHPEKSQNNGLRLLRSFFESAGLNSNLC